MKNEKWKYKISTKTVSAFVHWISRLPSCLEIPFWTFCLYRFWKYPTYHHLVKSGPRSCKKYYKEVIEKLTLLFITEQRTCVLRITQELSRPPVEHFWALMSMVACCYAHECSCMLMSIVKMSAQWPLTSAHKCSWAWHHCDMITHEPIMVNPIWHGLLGPDRFMGGHKMRTWS